MKIYIIMIGDYVILIKSGFHWGAALLVNFLSSLTAILGFFIGAAISSNSGQANGYILAITAGLFLYIALTDLVRLKYPCMQYNVCFSIAPRVDSWWEICQVDQNWLEVGPEVLLG